MGTVQKHERRGQEHRDRGSEEGVAEGAEGVRKLNYLSPFVAISLTEEHL